MEQTTAAVREGAEDGTGGQKITPSMEEFFTVVYTFLNGDMWKIWSIDVTIVNICDNAVTIKIKYEHMLQYYDNCEHMWIYLSQ